MGDLGLIALGCAAGGPLQAPAEPAQQLRFPRFPGGF
jgi:hypothetical protein